MAVGRQPDHELAISTCKPSARSESYGAYQGAETSVAHGNLAYRHSYLRAIMCIREDERCVRFLCSHSAFMMRTHSKGLRKTKRYLMFQTTETTVLG